MYILFQFCIYFFFINFLSFFFFFFFPSPRGLHAPGAGEHERDSDDCSKRSLHGDSSWVCAGGAGSRALVVPPLIHSRYLSLLQTHVIVAEPTLTRAPEA